MPLDRVRDGLIGVQAPQVNQVEHVGMQLLTALTHQQQIQ